MEINEEVVKEIARPYKTNIIIGTLLVAALIFAFITFTVGRYHPNSEIVDELVTKQLAVAKEKYETDMKAKDLEIARLAKEKKLSEAKFAEFKKKLQEADQKITDIVPPKTMKEAKARMGRAGYVVK
jgi:5-bromo-4-chloroindolyl phosphate hydrolysis protein